MAEEFTGWSSYVYALNNPLRFIDPTGMIAESPGDDVYVYKDDKGKTTKTEIVNTGSNTPNRLFVQDVSANEKTENRKEYEGAYFEIQMIPSANYTEKDYNAQGFLGSSQFDKDRGEYIWSGGRHSDKNWYQRLETSISDDPVTIDDLKTVFARSSKQGVGSSSSLGMGKGERGFSKGAGGSNNPFKHLKPDPNKPGNVLQKHPQTGKTVSKTAPEGFWEYWNKK